MKRLNWERGLTRAYVVLTIVWVVAWTVILRDAFADLGSWGAADFKAAAVVYGVAPITGYLSLLAVKWIIRGFLSPEQKEGRP